MFFLNFRIYICLFCLWIQSNVSGCTIELVSDELLMLYFVDVGIIYRYYIKQNDILFLKYLEPSFKSIEYITVYTPFPIAARHTLQWLKAELFSWESCHTSITTRHTVIKTELSSWESCLCAKSCKQCIVYCLFCLWIQSQWHGRGLTRELFCDELFMLKDNTTGRYIVYSHILSV